MDGLKKKQDAREQSSSLEREHHKTTWTWIGKTTKTGNKPDREENAKHLIPDSTDLHKTECITRQHKP